MWGQYLMGINHVAHQHFTRVMRHLKAQLTGIHDHSNHVDFVITSREMSCKSNLWYHDFYLSSAALWWCNIDYWYTIKSNTQYASNDFLLMKLNIAAVYMRMRCPNMILPCIWTTAIVIEGIYYLSLKPVWSHRLMVLAVSVTLSVLMLFYFSFC
jgi:hypothetical protein